jgi:hypothetical protein
VFNSNGWQRPPGLKAPTNHFYYPGGDFGGPVIIPGTRFNKNHDKLFFYAAYEYMNQQPAGSLTVFRAHVADAGRATSRRRILQLWVRTSPTEPDKPTERTAIYPGGQIPQTTDRPEFGGNSETDAGAERQSGDEPDGLSTTSGSSDRR